MRLTRGGARALAGLAIAGGALIGASPARAHVGVDADEITAGETTTLSFSFSHGCADAPTTSMRFQIPEGVNNAVPQVHSGWDIDVERAALAEPVESAHGEPLTDRPAIITFTARDGFEVPSGQRDTFSLTFTAPDVPGQLFFPVIQGCTEGSNDWIAPWDGTGDEPDRPAPSVVVVAATAPAGGGAAGTDAAGATTIATAAVESGGGDDDGGGSNTLAVAGLVVGALGLVAGGTALVRSGRSVAAPSA